MALELDVSGPRQSPAPLAVTLTELGTVDFQSAFASFDGSAAAAAFEPTLTVRSQNGTIVARSKASSVAAGASADVSWFPGLAETTSTPAPSSGGGYNALAESFGLVAWTFDPAIAPNTSRPFNADTLNALYLDAGTVVTSLSQPIVGIEATPPVHAYMALYDDTFALVAQTADTPSLGTSTGWNTVALSSPYTVPTSGAYYVGAFYDATANTPTTLSVLTNWSISATVAGGNYRAVQHTPALTSPPANFTITAASNITHLFAAL